MREAFEAWAIVSMGRFSVRKLSDGKSYVDATTQSMWSAWQAAIEKLQSGVTSATVTSDYGAHRLSVCYTSREVAERAMDALFPMGKDK